MKKMTEKLLAGALALLLCAAPVYADGTPLEMDTPAEADAIAAEITTFPYETEVELGDQFIVDPTNGSAYPATLLKLDLEEEDILQVCFGNEDTGIDTVVKLYRLSGAALTEITSFDYDPDNYGGFGTDICVPIETDGTYYLYCRGFNTDELGTCQLSVRKEEYTYADTWEALVGDAIAVADTVYIGEHLLGSSYYTAGDYYSQMYKLELEEGDTLTAFFGSVNDIDTCMDIYYDDGSSIAVYPSLTYDNDPNNYRCCGSEITWEIPEDGTWYVECRNTGVAEPYDFGMCDVVFVVNAVSGLDFTDPETPAAGDKYTWDASGKKLTLKDGFTMINTWEEKPTVRVPYGTRIVVQGSAYVSAMGDCIYAADDGTDGENTLEILLEKNARLRLHSVTDNGIDMDEEVDITITGASPETSFVEILAEDDEGIYTYGGVTLKNLTMHLETDEESIEAVSDIFILNCVLDACSEDEEGIYTSEGGITIQKSEITVYADEDPIDGNTFMDITDTALDLYSSSGDSLLDVAVDCYDRITMDRMFRLYSGYEAVKENLLGGGPMKYSRDLINFDDSENWYVDGVKAYRLITIDQTVRSAWPGAVGSMPTMLPLTVTAGEGGKASMSGNLLIALYDNRTIRFTADEGYEIADVLVNGESVGAVDSYRIVAAVEAHNIEVRFAPVAAEETAEEAAAEEA